MLWRSGVDCPWCARSRSRFLATTARDRQQYRPKYINRDESTQSIQRYSRKNYNDVSFSRSLHYIESERQVKAHGDNQFQKRGGTSCV